MNDTEFVNDAEMENLGVENEQTDATETAANCEPAEVADADRLLEEMVAAAEKRGYLRARRELAEAAMRRPELWKNSRREAVAAPKAKAQVKADTDFLTHLPHTVWD